MLELDGRGMAVLAEFLLRGPQTLGELRTRASRMKEIPDQTALDEVLQALAQRQPPIAARFTPGEVKRGVRWGHLLQDPQQVAHLIKSESSGSGATSTATEVKNTRSTSAQESSTVAVRLQQLEDSVRSLQERVQELERRAPM